MVYWFFKRIGFGPLLRLIWRPWIEGEENLPQTGGAILASNHLSFCDSVFLPLMAPRRVTFLAKAEYFNTRGIKGWLTRAFLSSIGMVPIDRTNSDAAKAALDTGTRLLRKGAFLGIYPEGTRSPDGRLYRGKTGMARMALESGVPIIPVAMIGTDKLQPQGRVIPNLRPRPGVRVGKPIDPAKFAETKSGRQLERAIVDEVMYQLMLLSGQIYVERYAADVKAEIAQAAEVARTADNARTDRKA